MNEERPIGKWVFNHFNDDVRTGNWRCSICKHTIGWCGYYNKPYYNYCPFCGAELRGNNNE